jgi:hypothetical protein
VIHDAVIVAIPSTILRGIGAIGKLGMLLARPVGPPSPAHLFCLLPYEATKSDIAGGPHEWAKPDDHASPKNETSDIAFIVGGVDRENQVWILSCAGAGS